MDSLVASADFRRSYLEYESYPLNLSRSATRVTAATLNRYKARLDAVAADLCLEDDRDVDLPIRDLYGSTVSGKNVQKCNIHTEERLRLWLNIKVEEAKSLVVLPETVPRCRFIYIWAENSRDQLRLTRKMLCKMLTSYNVMPGYLDFMFVFGAQSDARDLRFSGFRESLDLTGSDMRPSMLGGGGRRFQLCYNLKGVSLHKSNDENIKLSAWTVRQAAIYHQFNVVEGNSLWIVTKGRLDLQQRFKSLTGPDAHPGDSSFNDAAQCFASSLAAHLMYCQWSTEDWREYLRWLEDVVDRESSMAVYGEQGLGTTHTRYKPRDIQDIQYWKEKTSEAAMILEANVAVISALRRFYVRLSTNKDFPLQEQTAKALESFLGSIDEITGDFEMHIARAKLLKDIIGDRKELILQHLQGQAAERTEQLNQNLEKETIVMRIITIVTMFYLPATFVSTFFSTDIVKYQNLGSSGPGSFSTHALIAWLEVTLPLTLLTVAGAWASFKISERGRKRNKEHTDRTSQPITLQADEKKAWFRPGILRRRSTAKLPLFSEKSNPV